MVSNPANFDGFHLLHFRETDLDTVALAVAVLTVSKNCGPLLNSALSSAIQLHLLRDIN